jgi:hypothetical protein
VSVALVACGSACVARVAYATSRRAPNIILRTRLSSPPAPALLASDVPTRGVCSRWRSAAYIAFAVAGYVLLEAQFRVFRRYYRYRLSLLLSRSLRPVGLEGTLCYASSGCSRWRHSVQ